MKLKSLIKINKQNFLLLSVGLFLILFSIYRYYSIRVLTFNFEPKSEIQSSQVLERIKINKVGIDLKIDAAKIENGIWQISDDSASHLVSSGTPGEGENIVVYAHNKDNLFGPIRWLEIGDEIIIESSNGNSYVYKIEKSEIVNPDFIEPVMPKNEEILTLYTCTGLFDTKRFIVYARPDNIVTPE